jgi:prepilin-type processing-associated H-X9-DG protein
MIGQAIHLYAVDNSNRRPHTLEELIAKKYYPYPLLLGSYQYLTPDADLLAMPEATVIVVGPQDAYGAANVLYADGRGEYLAAESLAFARQRSSTTGPFKGAGQ